MTALRKITEMGNGKGQLALIYRNAEWDEYIVKHYITYQNGTRHHLKDADYHCSDLDDAKGTAKHWIIVD